MKTNTKQMLLAAGFTFVTVLGARWLEKQEWNRADNGYLLALLSTTGMFYVIFTAALGALGLWRIFAMKIIKGNDS